ncbi:MAG: hypothetical protein OEW17_01390, partial [Gemmatimonadota bacterium]|nr:hypothetical protein [Gemmatimonadota bacterium]
MSETWPETKPSAAAANGEPRLIWAAAAAVAGLGDWMLYDALPGLNWALWTGAAVAGLLVIALRRGHPPRSVLLMGGVPVVIAGAAAVTASPGIWALICLSVIFCLAMQMLLATSASLRSLTFRFAAIAPPMALKTAVIQAMRRGIEATNLIRSTRAREWVRGLAITLPVLIGFALLLAEADPVFAGWRDFVANWEFVPRAVFFVVLLVI